MMPEIPPCFHMKISSLRFGCTKVLFSDCESHFVEEIIVELAAYFTTDHCFLIHYHPPTNQILCRILPTTIDDLKKNWNFKLPVALWAYQTSCKVATHSTPFSLVYMIGAILPIELKVETLYIMVNKRLDVQSPLHIDRTF